MRIAVLGGCQAHGIAHALMAMLPEAEVESFEAVVIRHHAQVEAVAAALAGYEVVFTQDLDPGFGPLGTAALQAARPQVHRLPLLAFPGYQPDLVYLKLGEEVHASPVGAYHSAILAAAFSLGVPEPDVAQLFNRLTYQQLGYFAAFGKARAWLLELFASYGLALEAEFERWHAQGCFMHTINHPKQFALTGLAHAAAAKAGLLPPGAPVVEPPVDHLSIDTGWPVYPELAEALGIPGSLLFKRSNRGVEAGPNSLVVSLPRLIRECYALYPQLPKAVFREGEAGLIRTQLAAILG